MSQDVGNDGDRLRTVAEVAGMLRVSSMTVYRLIRSGELTALQIGRSYRVRQSDLDRYLGDTTVRVDRRSS